MKIILIRHGKPIAATNPKVNAEEFAEWVRCYDASMVSSFSHPNNRLKNLDSFYVVSSDLKRAIHSTQIYTGKNPAETFELFREMEIPRFKLPFRLRAWTWVYLNRVLWMIGLKGPFESYKEAKGRAEQATAKLIELAKQKGNVIVFGHGYMNYHVRKCLDKRDWRIISKSSEYWGLTRLEIP